MTILNLMICDECRKEKDLDNKYSGGVDTWQGLVEVRKYGLRVEKHVCSIDCAIKFLKKQKGMG